LGLSRLQTYKQNDNGHPDDLQVVKSGFESRTGQRMLVKSVQCHSWYTAEQSTTI